MNRPKGLHGPLAALVVSAGLLLSPACGGSDDEPAIGEVAFTPLAPTPGSGSITMQAGGTSGEVFQIRVAVKDVANFFGASFHVTYNPASAAFESSSSSGSFLIGGGVGTSFNAALVAPGDLAVVATRLQNGAGTVPGVAVVEGDLVVLTFRATAVTSGNVFGFGAPREVDAPDGTRLTVLWSGGTLTAR